MSLPWSDPVPKKKVQSIAEECKSRSTSWQKIACASQRVSSYFKGSKFGSFAAFCRSHATAFRKVLNKLDIPRSRAGYKNATYTRRGGSTGIHVANMIMITGEDGQVYSYILDVGWFPNKLFPVPKGAIKHHNPDSDGIVENIFPPIFPKSVKEIKYEFRPATPDMKENPDKSLK